MASPLIYLDFAPDVCLLDVEHLHGPEEVPYEMNELIVLCLVRNGIPWLASFVEHYFSLGVKHIVFLDNDSTDGTVSAASRYDNVTVVRTRLRVNAYDGAAEVIMRQYLVARFGRNRWSLCVDIDELFDYPYSDVIGLDSLLGYLNDKSFTAVTAHALDMFPEKPLMERSEEQDEPLKEVHRFYDLSNLVRWNKIDRQKKLLYDNNTLESGEVEWFAGGIRDKIFGFKPFLTNYPLVLFDEKTWPARPHYVYNATIADFTCVLFHYKFVNRFRERTMLAAQDWRNTLASKEYASCLEVLEKNPNLRLKQETAREIASVNDLLSDGFLVASNDYVSWVNAEEYGSMLRTARGEQEGLVRALLEARRRQRAETLRLGRAERQLSESRQRDRANRERIQGLDSELRDRRRRVRQLEDRLRELDRRLRKLRRRQRQRWMRTVRLEQQHQRVRSSPVRRFGELLRKLKAKVWRAAGA
jgi:hypothetical protein